MPTHREVEWLHGEWQWQEVEARRIALEKPAGERGDTVRIGEDERHLIVVRNGDGDTTRLAMPREDVVDRAMHATATIVYDVSPKDAAAQREKQFAAAALNRALIAAPHLPYPGIGHIRAEERGYTFVPVNYRDRHQP